VSASPLAAAFAPEPSSDAIQLPAIARAIAPEALDSDEVLLWTIMRAFEVQASAQYRLHTPVLAQGKAEVGPTLLHLAGDDRPLDESILGPTMAELVESAAMAGDEGAVLVAQGLVLERVRLICYSTLARLPEVPASSRVIAGALEPISAEIVARTPGLFASVCARTGYKPFSLFTEASDDVLHKLDAVGEGVDEIFGERFGLRFADIVGDFVADLVPACVELGMERRKVMSHLAGALMGI